MASTSSIYPPASYSLGGAVAGAVTIKDNEAPVIDLLAIDPAATEGGDGGTFRVLRRGNLAVALTIPVAWSGSAQNGVDVNTLPSSVALAANAASADLAVTVKQDAGVEEVETLTGAVQTGAGYSIGQGGATVRIADDEGGGTVSIRLPLASGYEFDAVPAYIEVFRTGGLGAAITVPYSLAGTATVRELTPPRQVVLPAGADRVRLVVTPLRDERGESNETVIIRLLSGAGYALGTSIEGTFTIIESPPGSG